MNFGSRFWRNATIASAVSFDAKFIACAVSSNSSASAIDTENDWLSSRFEIDSWTGGRAASRAASSVEIFVEVVGGHDPVHDADALGLGGVDDVGEEHELLRLVEADEARQQPRAAEVDVEAPLGEDLR